MAVGIVLLDAAWVLLHLGFYHREQIVDIPLYQRYGDAILDGRVPYRDFDVGYPPAALPVFVLPSLAPAANYRDVFEWLMIVCGAATIGFTALTLRSAGRRARALYAVTVFIGLAPLALGSVVLSRYDLWPAALTAAGLAALLAGRVLLAYVVLAVAVAAKLYPIVLLPLALAFAWRLRGRRAGVTASAVFAAVLIAFVLPFAVGGGLAESARGQAGRSLQLESTGAAVLLAADRIGAYSATVELEPGSHVLVGTLPDAVAWIATAVQALAVIAVWFLFWRGPASPDRLLLAAAAAVVAFVAFGRVFSPQYLIWLIPLVPLVAGNTGLAASGLLLAALVTTQLWFPSRYFDLVALTDVTWLVLARDLLMVALFAVLVRGLVTSVRARTGPT